MKKFAMVLGVSLLSFSSMSQASDGFDGCYQLYMPQTMLPVICLQGTTEEGIAGSGVRLAIFGTNTNKVVHCSRSSGSGMTYKVFTYMLKGKEELRLTVQKEKAGHKEGEAKLGKTTTKFIEIDDSNTERLLDIVNNSCRN